MAAPNGRPPYRVKSKFTNGKRIRWECYKIKNQHSALSVFNQVHRVLLGFTGFYCDRAKVSGFVWVSTGLYRVFFTCFHFIEHQPALKSELVKPSKKTVRVCAKTRELINTLRPSSVKCRLAADRRRLSLSKRRGQKKKKRHGKKIKSPHRKCRSAASDHWRVFSRNRPFIPDFIPFFLALWVELTGLD